MMFSSHLFVSAIGLGVAYNAAPGAVNTEALRRGLARGFRPALLVQLGALIGDTTWAALALTGTAFLVHNRSLRLVLGIAGACFLLRLAWSALQEAWSGGLPRAHGRVSRGDFATGAVFSLANPFALAFWTGIGAGLAATDTTTAPAGRFVVLFGGFALGALCWCLCIPFVIGWGRRFVRPAVFRWINALCGLGLSYFGLTLLWHTATDFLTHASAANNDV
ncbi:MAG: LysE family transporter [Thermomicrobiales bacterium]